MSVGRATFVKTFKKRARAEMADLGGILACVAGLGLMRAKVKHQRAHLVCNVEDHLAPAQCRARGKPPPKTVPLIAGAILAVRLLCSALPRFFGAGSQSRNRSTSLHSSDQPSREVWLFGSPSVQNTMASLVRVGWIGLGVMGKSMCSHLINAGYPATVYNRTPEKCAPLAALVCALLRLHIHAME